MRVRERLDRVARAAARRPLVTLLAVAALALAGGLLALGLEADTSSSTFVSSSSQSYRATEDFHRHFGDDAIVILIREPLPELVQTRDLATLTELEACLAGQVVVANAQLRAFTPAPAGSKPPYGGWQSPCGHLMRTRYVQVVYGPGTFLNRAVAAVNNEVSALLSGMRSTVANAEVAAARLALARHMSRAQAVKVAQAAGTLAQQQEETQLAQMALTSGITSLPSIDDPQFIPQVVFDQTRGVNQPKARFSYLFPTANAALIQVRLRSGLTSSQRAQAISWIRQAVRMPQFRSGYGGRYSVSGAPVVLQDLASTVTGSVAGLLAAALVVMAVTLLLVFRRRLRLLPLALALAAAGITFGALQLAGASLTMASIAVLPVLIGLAVDYAVQFQSGASAPTAIATAAAATGVGFLVLLLSPVPMVRGFGVLLVAGIAIAFACALTAGSAALALAARRRRGTGGARFALPAVPEPVAASARGAGEILAELGRPLRRAVARRRIPSSASMIGAVTRRPGRVLALAGLLAVAGWVADTQTSVQSDITKLVPSSMPALRDLHTLENVTGVSGEVDVTVRARDVTEPSIIRWMLGYEQGLLSHYGYLEAKGCGRATLCPALSLPDLFSGGASGAAGSGAAGLTKASIDALLAAVPSYFSQAVITPDHSEATLAFGIRLMPLARQSQVISYMRSRIHPPAGVSAQLVGLPVLAAEADSALSSSSRRLLTLIAGLLAVGVVLRVLLRQTRRALIPLVPIALATGWSALLLFVTGIPLNPMSATLGALVIAISTEFSVLLAERFRRERSDGHDHATALARTYASTGSAVLVSGVTAIAGFGVLILSSITMLSDFGLVTLIDLSVSLAGVLIVLPAVLVLADTDEEATAAGERLRHLTRHVPRARRRARVA